MLHRSNAEGEVMGLPGQAGLSALPSGNQRVRLAVRGPELPDRAGMVG